MNRHPVDGARLILQSEEHLDVAAVVAYEHHIMIDGGGYPRTRFKRDCHPASVLVHVCDVYDALRTNRPYRDAWTQEKTRGLPARARGQGVRPGRRRRVRADDDAVGVRASPCSVARTRRCRPAPRHPRDSSSTD